MSDDNPPVDHVLVDEERETSAMEEKSEVEADVDATDLHDFIRDFGERHKLCGNSRRCAWISLGAVYGRDQQTVAGTGQEHCVLFVPDLLLSHLQLR